MRPRTVAILIPALALLSGCVSTSISNDVPECERLVPPGLVAATEGVAMPESRLHPDGHQDAAPYIEGFVGQSGRLEIANTRPAAVDHIYRTCLQIHRERLRRSSRGFIGRLFG